MPSVFWCTLIPSLAVLVCSTWSLWKLVDLKKNKHFRYWASIRHVTRALLIAIISMCALVLVLMTQDCFWLWAILFLCLFGASYSCWIYLHSIPPRKGSFQFLKYCATENLRDIRQRFSILLIDTCDMNALLRRVVALHEEPANRYKLVQLARYQVRLEDAMLNDKAAKKRLFKRVVSELNKFVE